jgi:hypothetical protein
MPPARCEPSLFHAFDECRDSRLLKLCISVDKVPSPDSFFLFLRRVMPIEFHHERGIDRDYFPALSDEVNNDTECGNEVQLFAKFRSRRRAQRGEMRKPEFLY